MTEDELRRSWDYAWNYFSVHADQRLKTFHYYLIVCAGIGAVVAAMCRTPQLIWAAGILLIVSFPLLSLIFWRLDVRNQQLVGHGEAAIKHLEKQMNVVDGDEGLPHVLRIMTHEEFVTKRDLPFRYSHCLGAAFLALTVGGGILGLILIVYGCIAGFAPA
jgi:hypothetical protein